MPAGRAQTGLQTDIACNEPALPDTFFSRAEIVLRVSVTDGNHKPIAHLTREDFNVREDGDLQTISSFAASARAMSRATSRRPYPRVIR